MQTFQDSRFWLRSHGLTVTAHFIALKLKVYLVQKIVLFLRSSSDTFDSNARLIDGLCEDPIAAQIRKKISQVSQTNGSQDSLTRATTG